MTAHDRLGFVRQQLPHSLPLLPNKQRISTRICSEAAGANAVAADEQIIYNYYSTLYIITRYTNNEQRPSILDRRPSHTDEQGLYSRDMAAIHHGTTSEIERNHQVRHSRHDFRIPRHVIIRNIHVGRNNFRNHCDDLQFHL